MGERPLPKGQWMSFGGMEIDEEMPKAGELHSTPKSY